MKRSNFGVRIGHSAVFLLVFFISLAPITTHASTGFFTNLWCNVTEFFGFACDAPEVVVIGTIADVAPLDVPPLPPADDYPIINAVSEVATLTPNIVEEYNTYTSPTTVVYQTIDDNKINDSEFLDLFYKLINLVSKTGQQGNVVSHDLFDRQVDKIYEKSNDSTDSVQENLDTMQVANSSSFSTALLTVTGNTGLGGDVDIDGSATVGGDLNVIGTISAGVLNVDALSSGGALIAPYFTATSTTATSSFMGAMGIGTTTPSSKLTVIGNSDIITGNIDLDNTTNSNQYGLITKNGTRFLHDFNYGNNGTVITNGYNTFIGNEAGNLSMGSTATLNYEASQNTVVGYQTLLVNTTGFQNTAIGNRTLYSNTTGYNNTANSAHSLYSNTVGFNNTANGSSALFSNVTGSHNTADGVTALFSNTTGSYNTALGRNAGYDINTATSTGANTIIGYNTGRGITTGINNTILGANVTGLSSTLSNNIIIADGAGNQRINVDSIGNVGIGSTTPSAKLTVAGSVDITNIATSSAAITLRDTIGGISLELRAGTSTLENTFIGLDAGRLNITGGTNVAIGVSALSSNTTGGSNTAIGWQALLTNATGTSNTATGFRSLYANRGSENTAYGYGSLLNNTNGTANTAVGLNALGVNVDGSRNTAVGIYSLSTNVDGDNNTAIGYSALDSNVSGNDNTALGRNAGFDINNAVNTGDNTIIGYNTGRGIVTGVNNTILGANVTGLSSTLSNNIIIADGAGNQRINVDSIGNVGIGSTTPSSNLTVVGSSYISDKLLFDVVDTESGVVFAGDNYLAHSSWKDMPDSTGILLPMYIYPSSIYTNVDYNGVIDMKKRYRNVPLYVVLNPSDGPGAVVDGNFTVAIKRLRAAGAIVLGYIPTDYTVSISVNDAKTNVDTWRTLYPEIDGIFIDEMTNTASTTAQSYYTELTRYIHGKGFYPAIGNPGAGTVGEYFASSTADVIVVNETSSYPSETTLKGDYGGGYADFDYNKRAGLVYNSATLDTASTTLLKKYLGLIYVTDDTLPNPWDTVSPHLEDLFEMLSAENKRYFTDLYVDENIGIGTTTPADKLTVIGNTYLNGGLTLTGAFKDSTSATGTLGMIMQTTGTSTEWVATSTLGLGNGTFLGLSDTPSSFTANRLMFTNSGATALTDSANLVFDGTDLGLTGTTGLLLGGDTKLYRGFADTLYLDSGDSLNIVSGSIQVASTTVISGTREIRAGNGTASSPSFTFSSDTNTGLFRQAADAIGFTTGGTERLRLTTSDLDFQSGGVAFGGARYLYASSTNDSIVFGNNAGATFNSGTTFNTAIGSEAGRYASTSASDYNNFIGHQAGYGNTGERNNIIGITSGLNNTGSQNNLFGTAAGYNNTGSYNNIIGYWSGLNSTGSYNNFIGYQTSYKNVGNYNEIMGYQAGYNLQSTSSVIFGTEAYRGGSGVLAFQAVNNVALGYQAGYSARTGADNNILIGYKSADNLVSGSGNIIIGYDIDATSTTMTNALNIGNLIFGTGLDGTGTTLASGNIGIGTSTPSSKFTVTQSADTATGGFLLSTADNTDFRAQYMNTSGVLSFYGGDTAGTLNTATLNAAGEWTNASDISYKENIENLSNGLDIALALKPRTYDIKNTDNHRIGFIAQEVEGIVPEVVGGVEGSKGISYGNLVAVAISAIQQLAEKISSFASIFKSERIETETLCVGGTCVTETELQELLKSKQIETSSSSENNENTAKEPVIEVPVITTQDNTQKTEVPVDVITTDVVDEEKNVNTILVESPVAEPEPEPEPEPELSTEVQ